MSSLANAVKRKTHKERSQPVARTKYGLLEKRKDYLERARDFHRKEKTIKALKRKAEEKNPDEFYFAMEKQRTKGGVHDTSTGPNKYSAEELALMRSQDIKYLSLKRQTETKKVERLKESLHFVGIAPQSKHTVFVDSEQEAAQFDPAEYFDTPKELVGRSFNRPRQQQLTDPTAVVLPKGKKTMAAAQKAEKRKAAAYKELQQRMKRQAVLSRTTAHLEYQQLVAGKGRKRKLSKQEKAANTLQGEAVTDAKVFKWKRERSK